MLKKKFNWEENLDKFNKEQLMVLRMGLKEGVDVNLFSDPKIPWQKMWRIFYGLKLSHDIYMNIKSDMSKKLKR